MAAGARPRSLHLAENRSRPARRLSRLPHPRQRFPSASALAPVSVADGVTLAARWGSQGNGDGEFFGPHDIGHVDVAGNVYVTDVNNNRVQVFGADGRFLRKWG